jgi:hypothetical protein
LNLPFHKLTFHTCSPNHLEFLFLLQGRTFWLPLHRRLSLPLEIHHTANLELKQYCPDLPEGTNQIHHREAFFQLSFYKVATLVYSFHQ